MSPMPHAIGRKTAAVGSLVTGAVLAAVSPAPHAHAAEQPLGQQLGIGDTTPTQVRMDPHIPTAELTGAVTQGLGTVSSLTTLGGAR